MKFWLLCCPGYRSSERDLHRLTPKRKPNASLKRSKRRDAFQACVEQALVPELRPGDIVIICRAIRDRLSGTPFTGGDRDSAFLVICQGGLDR